ncbi:hypothetical protein SlGVgp023 [Spodoptera litura granulovirus]|uniref:Uncharacterized protein n=1 Tax=Spodoptera litura granulovirus TaxID=359919 RepID=A5IZM5_9BBAC|nr:hypothetical protein SlGVgp023 [Spodoptera litura granulovirus]ABQ51966.1 hypothetical protein SlGVgp023 [Spodoptera litura granulovirus]
MSDEELTLSDIEEVSEVATKSKNSNKNAKFTIENLIDSLEFAKKQITSRNYNSALATIKDLTMKCNERKLIRRSVIKKKEVLDCYVHLYVGQKPKTCFAFFNNCSKKYKDHPDLFAFLSINAGKNDGVNKNSCANIIKELKSSVENELYKTLKTQKKFMDVHNSKVCQCIDDIVQYANSHYKVVMERAVEAKIFVTSNPADTTETTTVTQDASSLDL